MKQKQAVAKDIGDYVAGFPEVVQAKLAKVRTTIRKAAPLAEETISYQIPTFTLRGVLVHFAAFRNHIGFYPGAACIAAFRPELASYKSAKGSVQFPLDRPIPTGLITRMVEFKVTANSDRQEAKRGTR